MARIFVLEYLQTHHCVDCGESDPRCLTFDHIDPATKTETVSVLMGRGAAILTIHAEVEKCEVRCANCHSRKTSDELSYYTSSEPYAEYVLSSNGKTYPKRDMSASERGTSRKSAREKPCARCFKAKPLDDFHKRGGSAGNRRQSWCKDCKNAVRRAEEANAS